MHSKSWTETHFCINSIYSLKLEFYPSGSIVIICGDDPQWRFFVVQVHRHGADCRDHTFVLWALKLGRVETLHQNPDCDGGGGNLKTVLPLSSLGEKNIPDGRFKHRNWHRYRLSVHTVLERFGDFFQNLEKWITRKKIPTSLFSSPVEVTFSRHFL